MAGSAATSDVGGTSMGVPYTTEMARRVADWWWVMLVVGIGWVAASLTILQFDQASVTTIGVIIGILFAVAAAQQFALAAFAPSLRWLWALFGVIFAIAAVLCFISPENTFAGLADTLGFLFLAVGVWWIIRAFLEQSVSPGWWLGLVAGMLMVVLAFWTSGQFFLERSYTLLVFAGVWTLMQGVTDIVRAFQLRSLRDEL